MNIKTKIGCLLFLTLNFSSTFHAQYFPKYNLGFRGKFLPFGLEDVSVIGYSVGFETVFFKRHSIGLDYVGWKIFGEYDDDNDEGMYKSYTSRKSFYLDYKFSYIQKTDFEIFGTLFWKFSGKYNEHNKKLNYDFPSDFQYEIFENKTEASFEDIGCGLGGRFFFSPQFGIESSFSYYKRWEEKYTKKYNTSEGVFVETNESIQSIKPLFRVSLFLYLF